MSENVVITGMGVVSPVGSSLTTFWDALISGKSGVGPITHFDASNFAVRIAGEVKDFDASKYVEPKEARRFDRFLLYAIGAAAQAVEDAGLDSPQVDKTRVGVIVGSGVGGIQTIENNVDLLTKRGPSRVSPFFVPMTITDMASGLISIRHGFMGPNYSVSSACSTAGHAMIDAANLIRLGKVDAVVCGGAEGTVSPVSIAGFHSAQALSTRCNDDPTKASRPFDLDRDGFVMGEGAGVLVLESESHARRRGARILAVFAGYGMSGDAYHITAPHPEGRGSILALREALRDAQINPEDVDYVNAHGTSTHLNDKAETAALKEVFGEAARKFSVSSTKSMTGHLLGASAAIEMVACVQAIRTGIITPTINRDTPDPECDLDVTPNVARERKVKVALKNSLGFGGHNAVLILKAYEG